METIQNFIFAAMVAVGLYFILADIFEIPTFRSVKTVLSVNKRLSDSNKKSQSVLYTMAQFYVGLFRTGPFKLDDYKKSNIETALASIGDTTSAEMYQAIGFTKILLTIVLSIICFMIFPILAVLALGIGITNTYTYFNQPRKLINERRQKIEADLPRFISIIEQEIKNKHEVFTALEYYQRYACPELGEELRTTLADMRSGNPEGALLRLESRVGSNQLSEVIRGLIRALSGDDPLNYIQMIAGDFRTIAISNLEKEVLKRPDKITKYSFLVLVMVVVTILVIMGLYTYDMVVDLM